MVYYYATAATDLRRCRRRLADEKVLAPDLRAIVEAEPERVDEFLCPTEVYPTGRKVFIQVWVEVLIEPSARETGVRGEECVVDKPKRLNRLVKDPRGVRGDPATDLGDRVQLATCGLRLGAVAPAARERATLEVDCGSDPGPVVGREAIDIEDEAGDRQIGLNPARSPSPVRGHSPSVRVRCLPGNPQERDASRAKGVEAAPILRHDGEVNTLLQLSARPTTIPAQTAWYLADLAEAIGRQKLYTLQSPEKLRKLREFALIESAVSSNRIEGVRVDDRRIGTLMFGSPHFQDRDEEEVRGYRDALNLVHDGGAGLPVTEETINRLHKLCRGEIWDAGQYKEKDVDIIQTYPDGRSRVRFCTTPAADTPSAMARMVSLWDDGIKERWAHPLVLSAALNLDFLCIHPFRDGNGRVSRLLFLLTTYQCGMEAGRYVSIERVIEQNKDRYYEVLEQSSVRWHECRHDPWPTINFLLYVLVRVSKEFEAKIGRLRSARGEKTAAVRAAVGRQKSVFRVADIRAACPGVGIDLIRRVLADLRDEGKIAALGTGRSARWEKTNYV